MPTARVEPTTFAQLNETTFVTHNGRDSTLQAVLDHVDQGNDIQTVHVMRTATVGATLVQIPDDAPATLEEAATRKDGKEWMKAYDTEVSALQANDTWEVVPASSMPKSKRKLRWKIVFKIKMDATRTRIEKYKARVCVKGFTQRPGQDYSETYAPVTSYDTVRIALSVAASRGWLVETADVKNAFVQAELHDEIYMELLPGMVTTNAAGDDVVLCLRKSLYGLKQAATEWNHTLDAWMRNNGFNASIKDPCLYVHAQRALHVLTYVDDLLIMGAESETVEWFKRKLTATFASTLGGHIKQYLGMVVKYDTTSRAITLTQQGYLAEVLMRFGYAECRVVKTPEQPSSHLSADDDAPRGDLARYQSIVGSLMYGALLTRPDLSHAVGQLARFAANPTKEHEAAAERVLRYLSGTARLCLTLTTGELTLRGYADADFAGDPDSAKSTTGYIFKLGAATIAWSSKLQGVTANSTTCAEYIALNSAGMHGLYLLAIMRDLGVEIDGPLLLFEDNKPTIATASGTQTGKSLRHLRVAFHWLKEQVAEATIKLEYISTTLQVADLFTKALPAETFLRLSCVALGAVT